MTRMRVLIGSESSRAKINVKKLLNNTIFNAEKHDYELNIILIIVNHWCSQVMTNENRILERF